MAIDEHSIRDDGDTYIESNINALDTEAHIQISKSHDGKNYK